MKPFFLLATLRDLRDGSKPSICFSAPGMCWGGGTFSYPNIPHLLYIFQVDWLQPPLASSNEGIGSMMRSKCHKESSLVVEMRGVFVRVGALEGGDDSYLGQMMKIATNTQNSSLIAKAASSASWGGKITELEYLHSLKPPPGKFICHLKRDHLKKTLSNHPSGKPDHRLAAR